MGHFGRSHPVELVRDHLIGVSPLLDGFDEIASVGCTNMSRLKQKKHNLVFDVGSRTRHLPLARHEALSFNSKEFVFYL